MIEFFGWHPVLHGVSRELSTTFRHIREIPATMSDDARGQTGGEQLLLPGCMLVVSYVGYTRALKRAPEIRGGSASPRAHHGRACRSRCSPDSSIATEMVDQPRRNTAVLNGPRVIVSSSRELVVLIGIQVRDSSADRRRLRKSILDSATASCVIQAGKID